MAKAPTRLSDFAIPREHTLTPIIASEEVTTNQRPTSASLDAAETRSQAETLPSKQAPAGAFTQGFAHATVPAIGPPERMDSHPIPRPALLAAEEPRRQIGARIRLSIAERLRTYLYVSRESQQDAVEAALDAYLLAKGF